MRRKSAAAVAAVVILASSSAWAQAKGAPANEGLAAFLRLMTERIDITFSQLPDVWRFLVGVAHRFNFTVRYRTWRWMLLRF